MMMTDVDEVLGRLSALPPDGRLETMDSVVFSRLAEIRERRAHRAIMGSLALAALMIGATGGAMPDRIVADIDRSSVSLSSPLAPAKLLAAGLDH